MDNLEYSLVRQIIRSFLAGYSIGTVVLRARNSPPITIKEAHIIETIEAFSKTNDNINLKIAHALASSESTLSITVKNLVKKGYVYRKQGVIDKRNIYLFNSDKCQNVLHNQTEFHFQHKHKLLHNFSSQEIDKLLRPIFLLANTLNDRLRETYPNYFLLTDQDFKDVLKANKETKETYFYSLFVKAFYSMVQVSESILNKASPRLTIPELIIIKTINSYDESKTPLSNNLMSFILKLSNSTISITLNKLQEKKYIKRSFDAADRRAILINLTAKAKKAIDANMSDNIKLFAPLLNQTDNEEKRLLLKLFINMYDFFASLKF